MVVHSFNPSTQEAERSISQWFLCHPGLYRETKASQGYIERSCLKKGTQIHYYKMLSWKKINGNRTLKKQQKYIIQKNAIGMTLKKTDLTSFLNYETLNQ